MGSISKENLWLIVRSDDGKRVLILKKSKTEAVDHPIGTAVFEAQLVDESAIYSPTDRDDMQVFATEVSALELKKSTVDGTGWWTDSAVAQRGLQTRSLTGWTAH
jgi:hypothetical protein